MSTDLNSLLSKYADLVVKVGLNVQAGQRLVMYHRPFGVNMAAAPFVRAVTASAYRAGARLVDVIWNDEEVELARFRYAPPDSFTEFPARLGEAMAEYARNRDAILSVAAATPDLLKDIAPEWVATVQRTSMEHYEPFLQMTGSNETNWCVAGAATPGWATKVFPELSPSEAQARLWDAIFAACRVDRPDPIAAWRDHVAELRSRSDYLNDKAYAALHYRGPGTDLRVGLPAGHIWTAAGSQSQRGVSFVANIPTEEVFTLPSRLECSGTLRASRPLSYGGALIEDFALTFEGGRVVDVEAKVGESALRKLVATDEGAGRLGELALVPHSSPISQTGTLFYNTLFDENAACHVALGRAYRFTLDAGIEMTADEFLAAGGNQSLVHVDFMIGSGELDIDGLMADGQAEAVFRSGEWAFDV